MRAAVPTYVGTSFGDCPPGHRFSLYFPVWRDHDWQIEKDQKSKALKQTLELPPHVQKMLAALRERQAILLDALPEAARLSVEANSTAPFATGLGMEHPLENGFAFLNPYGLTYLPASSIKGVLRRAAKELADELLEGDCKGWTQEVIDLLFGLESEDRQNKHTRGLLTFWDALPKPAQNTMGMEVTTPHYTAYYQAKESVAYPNGATPHDSGQPNPIVFLVVPVGSEFSFHLTCNNTHRLPEDLRASWQALMRAAFEHAFDWLGFGAKTAVGYGAMKRDEARESTVRKQREERARRTHEVAEVARLAREKEAARQHMDPIELSIQDFLDTRPDKNQPEISAVIGAMKQDRWQGEEKVAVARWLKARMQAAKGQWKETSRAKKPEKDREYQNTLLVMRWLESK